MFRARQKMQPAAAFPVVFATYETNESGQTVRKEVDQSEVELPDSSTTDISSLLAAGIEPRRVNTRILSARSVVTDLSVEPQEPETKIDDKGE